MIRSITPASERPSFTHLAPHRLPSGCGPFLSGLKQQLVATLGNQLPAAFPHFLVRQAVSDAEALASLTPYPSLFLPALAEEKVAERGQWFARQRRLDGGREDSFAA